jgi:hypothetical protein
MERELRRELMLKGALTTLALNRGEPQLFSEERNPGFETLDAGFP